MNMTKDELIAEVYFLSVGDNATNRLTANLPDEVIEDLKELVKATREKLNFKKSTTAKVIKEEIIPSVSEDLNQVLLDLDSFYKDDVDE